jgi:hypothetical protein
MLGEQIQFAILTLLTKSLQVDKLKVLATSLANSSSKAEKRILDHRCSGFFNFPIRSF